MPIDLERPELLFSRRSVYSVSVFFYQPVWNTKHAAFVGGNRYDARLFEVAGDA